jgi:GntR family trehalose operon transcriptional repressor
MTIYDQIVHKIEKAHIKPGECLPSEAQLMKQYDVSRDTVRKALSLLKNNNYIIKQRGKESIVNNINKFNFPLSSITTFSELVQQQGLDVNTIVEDLSIVIGDEELMDILKVDENEEIYRVKRIREIDGERVILDKNFFLKSRVPVLNREICKKSIYYYLENELGLKISNAKKIITVNKATVEDKLLLDLKGENYVVVVKSFTQLVDATLFQYTESHHRIDKFQFVEYLARR